MTKKDLMTPDEIQSAVEHFRDLARQVHRQREKIIPEKMPLLGLPVDRQLQSLFRRLTENGVSSQKLHELFDAAERDVNKGNPHDR